MNELNDQNFHDEVVFSFRLCSLFVGCLIKRWDLLELGSVRESFWGNIFGQRIGDYSFDEGADWFSLQAQPCFQRGL